MISHLSCNQAVNDVHRGKDKASMTSKLFRNTFIEAKSFWVKYTRMGKYLSSHSHPAPSLPLPRSPGIAPNGYGYVTELLR